MSRRLMSERRFAPLFWSQFCSALNDNFLKQSVGMLVLFGIGATVPFEHGTAEMLNTLAGVVFIGPFFFLSALGGELADKFDKGRVASTIKLAEMPIAALAAAGFYTHSVPVLFVALFGFGVVGALFGPVKYGILPEALSTDELSAGNALVEGATFLAILIGTIGGGIAVTEAKSPELIVGIILVLAVVCWLSATLIPRSGAAAPLIAITRNPFASTVRLLRELKAEPRLRVGGHFCSAFWLIGIVSMSLLPVLVTGPIGGAATVYTYALATFTVGIALGSLIAARAGHERPNLALVPIGALLMALAAAGLAALAWSLGRPVETLTFAEFAMTKRCLGLTAALLGLSVGGGMFIVPAFASVQSWAPADRRARIVAAVNVLNAAYMTIGGILLFGLQSMGMPLWAIFAAVSITALTLAVLVVRFWGLDGERDTGRSSLQHA